MSDFAIRQARPDELRAVGDITLAAYTRDGLLDADEPYATVIADAAARASTATLLVAIDADESIIGSVTFCRAGNPYAELAVAGEAEFRMLGVASTARRRGVGEALTQACIDLARRHGDHAIVLSSQPTMPGEHRIYERLGFVRVPERDHEPEPGIMLLVFRYEL